MPRIKTRHREEARNQIIAAALTIAAKNGWDEVTLDAIAQHVGVTKPALYSYFKNRNELLHEVVLEVILNIRNEIETIVTKGDDIHLIIQKLAGLLFEQQKTYASIFFLLPARPPQDPEYREEFIQIFDSGRILIRDCLVRVKGEGKFSLGVDPDRATSTVIAMSMGLLISSDFLEMGAGEAKTIWIEAVERALLLEPGAE